MSHRFVHMPRSQKGRRGQKKEEEQVPQQGVSRVLHTQRSPYSVLFAKCKSALAMYVTPAT